MVSSRLLLPIALLGWCVGAHAQQVNTLVQFPAGQPRQIALGYPVPVPIDSVTPVAGFRSYASLRARLADLALRSPDLRMEVVGTTLKGRPIEAWVLGDADGLAGSGAPAPGMLLNATIHAREWQAPEVAVGIVERFTHGADDFGMVRFLLDEMRTVVIPVFNVDGFLMTQNNPDQVWVGADPSQVSSPRDGRMRRKNLRAADEDFASVADHLQGVDLNRNFEPFWASNNSSSSDSRSLVHHGAAPRSEPESQALVNAVSLIGAARLRVFEDIHSFGEVMNTVRRGAARSDGQTALLAGRFAAHHAAINGGRFYDDLPNPNGTGIGTTSEYFAYTYQIPTWTLELEPGQNGSSEYGSAGWHHDGFVLPASEITRLRERMAETHVLLAYHVAGPAILQAVRLIARDSGSLVAESRWRADSAGGRVRESTVHAPLRSAGQYRLWLAFDRPLRVAAADGTAALFPGQTGVVQPAVSLRLEGGASVAVTDGRWALSPGAQSGEVFDRYRGDAWSADFDLPAFNGAAPGFALSVDVTDAIGRRLDARPQTVADWRNGAWSAYENTAGVAGDLGGADEQQSFAALAGTVWIATGSSTHVAEGEVGALLLERASGAAPGSVQLSYSGGLSGPAELRLDSTRTTVPLRVAEDAVVADSRDREATVSVQVAGQATLIARISIRDNDTATERVWQALDTASLAQALATELSAGSRLTVQLQPGGRYVLTEPLPELRGKLRLQGQRALLVPAAGRSLRLLRVAVGAEVQVEDLRLEGGAGLDSDGGQLQSAGRLVLQRVESTGASGRCGGVLHSSGHLVVERSSFSAARAVSGGVFCIAAGTAAITSSTIVDARADRGGVLLNRGASTLDFLTLDGNAVADGGALLDSPEGSVQLAASVLSSSTGAQCAGSVQSSGDNLLHPGRCNEQSADFLASEALLAAPVDGTQVRLLRSGPWDSRMPLTCSGLDQSGLPRPQQGRCEAGARERDAIAPVPGLWWTPSRSGQGVDLKRAGDGLLALVYTYDQDGRPLLYTAQGPYTGPNWRGPLLRWRQAPVSLLPESTVVGELSLDFSDARHAALRLSLDGGATASYGLEAFSFGDESDPARLLERTYSGASRYGLSYARHGDTPFALLYAYDAAQVLRWASGEQTSDPATLKLRSFTGSCPACSYAPPVASDAGELRLFGNGLDVAEGDFALRFGNGAGGALLREAAALERLDAP